MENETIGAFEAKTHFSRILREVAQGRIFHVTHRGRRVAVIKKEEEHPSSEALSSLKRLSKYQGPTGIEEILSLRDAGRER